MTLDTDQPLRLLERAIRGWRGAVLLTVLCLAVYLPGLSTIPPIDRDEARFAQASRQMFESTALPDSQRIEGFHDGGLAVPKIQDVPRLNKPPLIYWLQSASAAIFTGGQPARDAIWMYRLPSMVCSIVAVLFTWRLGTRLFDELTGLLGAAGLAVCPMLVWDAHQARADQLLLACTTSAIAALWALRSRPASNNATPWLPAAWLWTSIALGILAKGPVTPLVVGLTALCLCAASGEWRWLRRTMPLLGAIVLTLCIAPWIVLVARHVGADVLWTTLLNETLGRTAAAREGHFGPPGYHTLFSAVLLWPASLLTLGAFIRTWKLAVRLPPPQPGLTRMQRWRALPARWRERVLGRWRELFLVCWIAPSWLVFELVMTKLPHYTMPMYPALALISAAAIVDAARARIDTATGRRAIAGLNIWFAIGIALCCIIPIGFSLLGGGAPAIAAAASVALACFFLLRKAREEALEGLLLRAQAWGIAAMVLFLVATFGLILPRARVVFVYPRAAAALPPDRPVACAGHFEDSVVFLTRGRVALIAEHDLRSWLASHPNGVAVVTRSQSAGELDLQRIHTFAGYNYANGRFVTLDIVERAR